MTAILGIDLPKIFYNAGEVLSGSVIYQPKTERQIYGIQLSFTGFEFCENHVLADMPYQKKWILNGTSTLYGKKPPADGSKEVISEREGVPIKPGRYSWPFSFKVPRNVPPSAEYKNGKIKIEYTIICSISVPWSKGTKCTQTIRIGMPYLLDPERPPHIVRNEKSFLIHTDANTDPNRQHNLKMMAWLDKIITYSGDKVQLNFKVDNNSGRVVQSLKLKVRQVWIYGNNYLDKNTIYKVTHKDPRAFPMHGTGNHPYEGHLQITIPNVEGRPTINNASLIKCDYYMSLRAQVKGAIDLKCRVPFLVASFEPTPKDSTASSSQNIPAQQSPRMAPKVIPNLIDWDAPEQQSNNLPAANPFGSPEGFDVTVPEVAEMNPFQPSAQQLKRDMPEGQQMSPFPVWNELLAPVDAKIESRPSQQTYTEAEYQRLQAALAENAQDLETSAQWAGNGQYDQCVDVPNNTTMEMSQNDMVVGAKQLVATVAKLVEQGRNHKDEETLAQAGKVVLDVAHLSHRGKVATAFVGDVLLQQGLLQHAKAVVIAAQQLLFAGKDAAAWQQATAAFDQNHVNGQLDAAAKNVADGCQSLLRYSQQALQQMAARGQEVNKYKTQVDQFLQQFENPFGATTSVADVMSGRTQPTTEGATIETTARAAQAFGAAAGRVVAAAHGTHQEISAASDLLAKTTEELLKASFGLANSLANLAQPLQINSKAGAQAASRLLGLAGQAARGTTGHSHDDAHCGPAHAAALVDMRKEMQTAHQHATKILDALKAAHQQKQAEEAKKREAELKAAQEAAQKQLVAQQQAEMQRLAEEQAKLKAQQEAELKKLQEAAMAPPPLLHAQQVNVETRAEDELMRALQALSEATAQLAKVKNTRPKSTEVSGAEFVDHRFEVVDSAAVVAGAMQELLAAAHLSQKERVKASLDPSAFYHRDETWIEGLISAAKTVVALVQELVKVASSEHWEEEKIISLTRAISGATAQLVAAERAKVVDPNSETHARLLRAARMVAQAISQLVSTATECTHHQHEKKDDKGVAVKVGEDPSGMIQSRLKELEAAAQVAKLEKELERARNQLGTVRKEQYQ